MINNDTFSVMLENHIKTAVDSSIEVHIEKVIDQLTLDPSWVTKIENLINQNYTRKFGERISTVDFDHLIGEHIDRGLDRWQQKLLQNFRSKGIADSATKTELTIMDQTVVAENDFVSRNIQVEQDANVKGTMTVQNLCVKGSVNVDSPTWEELRNDATQRVLSRVTESWTQDLVQQVLDAAKKQGIDFSSVTIDGNKIIEADTLAPGIRHSSLSSLGVLDNLTVSGDTNLSNTLFCRKRRLGINTENPEMALSIWDDEVSLIMGKLRENQAYLGTSRNQNLTLGVNQMAHLEIDTTGLTTVKKLRVGRYKVDWANEVPNYSGTKGDLVINNDYKPNGPFAWLCLGAFRWQPLKTA